MGRSLTSTFSHSACLSQAVVHSPADTHSSCPSSAANVESEPHTPDNSRNSVKSSRWLIKGKRRRRRRRLQQCPSSLLDLNQASAARNKEIKKKKPQKAPVRSDFRWNWRNIDCTSANRAQVKTIEGDISPRAACVTDSLWSDASSG